MREQDSLEDKLQTLADRHGMFRREAYLFVLNALETTVQGLPERRHVTGYELVHGIRAYGAMQFGDLAVTVFRQWGITATVHFGEIVFHLISTGLLAKTEHDSLDDFKDVFDLQAEMRDAAEIAVDANRINRFFKGGVQ